MMARLRPLWQFSLFIIISLLSFNVYAAQTCVTTIVDPDVEIRAISGRSDSDIFAVGKVGKGKGKGKGVDPGSIYRYDPLTMPPSWPLEYSVDFELREIEMISTGEAWAVGKDGRVLEYNGSVWGELPPTPAGEDLRGVWSDTPGEVWVVGKDKVHWWDSVAWTWTDMAVPDLGGKGELRSAWGGSSYFYAAEKDGDLYRYNRPATSGSWDPQITVCNDLGGVDIERIWGNDKSGNIYLAGKGKGIPGAIDGAIILRYNEGDGMCYPEYSTNTADKFNGIAGNGGTVYAVGKNGLVVENTSGGSWSETTEGTEEFKDVWVSGSNTAYYAGKNGSITVCEPVNVPLHHFVITPATSSASTCLPNAITIVAEDAFNMPILDYSNQVNITVNTGHGNWSINDADGILSPDGDDDGAVSYTFVDSDNGVAVLDLTNTHAESLTITVFDAVENITSDSLVPIAYSRNTFIITEDDAIQVAGKPKPMTIALWTDDAVPPGSPSPGCAIDTNYASATQSLEVSVTRSAALPAANPPFIGAVGAVSIPDSPTTDTVVLDFNANPGQASFFLGSDDVGQFTLIMQDTTLIHSDTIITGSSSEMTLKPFGLKVAIFFDVTRTFLNPGTITPGGTLFTDAGANFSADVEAVLWSADDDQMPVDGVLDTGDYSNNTSAPSYAWDTTLSVAVTGFEPSSGIAGILNNGDLAQVSFGGGKSSPDNLQYTEVGSFTLQALATDYLGVGTADIVGDSVVIGRFRPASFLIQPLTVVSHGAFADTCSVYSYIGENFGYDVNPSFELHALNALGDITTNYTDPWEKIDITSVDFTAPTSDQTKPGTTAILMPLTYTQDAALFSISDYGDGTFDIAFANDQYVFDRDSNSEVTPFASDIDLLINDVTDSEGVTTTVGTTLTPASANLRFGRVRMANVHGSELSDLAMPMIVEYFDSPGPPVPGLYTINSDDDCTTIATANLGIADNLSTPGSSLVTVTSLTSTAVDGVLGVTLTSPGAGVTGNIDVTPDLSTLTGSDDPWLQYDWTPGGGVFDEDPTAQATFGIYKGNDVNIYKSQTYQQ
jgi:hypothetical protein